ncbi:MAG TPA: hypothetical protein VGM27_11080 [Acidobacteriaceae bacterium]
MNFPELSVPFYSRARHYMRPGPGHFLMYIFGRFRVVRSFMVWIYRQSPATPLPTFGPAFVEDVEVDGAVREIRQHGFFSGLQLSNEVVEQLRTFSSFATCFGDGKVDFPFRYADKPFAEQQATRTFRLGKYHHALRTCPALQALASDPKLLAIARAYFGCEPVLLGARLWWSFAGPADPREQMAAGQGYHYDIDGYRGLTFFFYLTDVESSNGPHVYIRGSHVNKPLKHLVSMYKGRSDAQIDKFYGRERQVILCGPAGFGFAEDTFGFHKGLSPENSDRLMVQVRYGLHDYGTGRND